MTIHTNDVTGVQALIRRALLNNAVIQAAVVDRVWTAHPKSSDRQSVGMPGIVLDEVGGFSRYAAVVQDVTIDLWVYSVVSQTQASTLYRACFEVLQGGHLYDNTVGASGDKVVSQICVSREISRPRNQYVDRYDAWTTRGRWSIMSKG